MSDCSLLTPLRRDGTSQRQRMPAALDPCAAPLDGRPTSELLLYAGDLARLLKFYTEENVPKGDWSAFIEHDVSTMAARVGAYDGDAAQETFETLRAAAAGAGTAAFPAAFAALTQPLFALAQTFEDWRRGSLEGLQLRTRLDRVIEGVLAEALRDAIRAARRANVIGAHVALPSFGTWGDSWSNLDPPPDLALFGSGGFAVAAERAAAVDVIAHSFERFHETAKRLAADAPGFLADTLANYPQHRPHIALFLAFLRLFNHARAALNSLTDEHLDFYYRDVLRLVPRGPVADRVHVLFELAKHLPPCRVPEATALNAGKDATGVPLVYGTDSEIVVNRAHLDPADGLKTVFVDIGAGDVVRNVYAAGDADSDAIAPPVNGEKRWPTVGNATLPFARLGFAVASPMLWLAEGTREIGVTFELGSADFLAGRPLDQVMLELSHNVVVEATGPKGWITAQPIPGVPRAGIRDGRFLDYVLEFSAADPAVVAFDPATHLETFDTTLPMLRFLLKNDGLPGELLSPAKPVIDYSDDASGYAMYDLVRFEGRVYQASQAIAHAGFRPTSHPESWLPIEYTCPYKYYAGMQIQSVTLTVYAGGVRGVVLQNDFGKLNPAKPFAPFGAVPRVDSSLFIGSWEIFQKPVTTLWLHLKWSGLPTDKRFKDYYAGYTGAPADNGHFTAAVEILKDGAWLKPGTDVALFDSGVTTAPPAITNLSLVPAAGTFPAKPALDPIRLFHPGLDRGFMRVRLTSTFLHEKYQQALNTHAVNVASYAADLAVFVKSGGTKPTLPTPPNPPYTPMISELTVTSYTAIQTIDYASWTRDDLEGRVDRLFQIGPFGHQEFAPVSPAVVIPGVESAFSPVPMFVVSNDDAASGVAEGSLFLGVAGLLPPQNVSILFQMAEGSEDPALPAQDVQWGYLTASGWKDFAPAEILLDTTNELIASGIVQFAIPKTAINNATLLPSNLHWVRATVQRNSGAIPKTIAVLPQAVQASFRDNGNDPAHLESPLPAGTIAKLLEREAAIKSVSQPFSSFGGRMAESDAGFRVRVAERLRHKRRAVTIFDYERLVLERFPEVYKVRCLSHTGPDSEYAPGSVRIVVVPNLRNRNAVDPLRPRLALSRLEEIRQDLADMASDFADIQVVNPDYEEVRIHADVRFKKGFDAGFYTGQLEQDLIRYLSPWLYDEGVDLAFGNRVHRSSILNFMDEREYVDFIANFTMDHIIPGATAAATQIFTDVEEAEPTRSSGVIVPSSTHEIGDAIVSCYDEPSGTTPAPAGPASPAPLLPPGTPRYLGNSHTRELHDLLNITPSCQIDEIGIDRKYPFRTIADALALGYDYCAYCFGPGMSQR